MRVLTEGGRKYERETDMADASRVRALLLELIRRAAHDWVLYRTSRRKEQQLLAEDAHTWLFVEGPGHPWWDARAAEGRSMLSFVSVCDILDMDVDAVRSRIRQLTPRQIKMAGRPAERRQASESYYAEHSVSVELHFTDD